MHLVLRNNPYVDAGDVVRAELAAWQKLDVDAIMAPFAADAVWQAGPRDLFNGYDAIRHAVEAWVRRMTSGEIEIVNLAVAGNIVLTERIDRFTFDGNATATPVMGAFEVVGDKIAAWRDYFDMSGH